MICRSVAVAVLVAGPAQAGTPDSLDTLVRAYPDWLAGYDATDLIWRDGTRMRLSAAEAPRSFDEKLRNPSILDQLSLRYPAGPLTEPSGPEDDPGRFRYWPLFEKMYGDCRRGEVTPHLVPVVWLPRSWGRTVMATSVNGVARHLQAVSAELDVLPDPLKRYLYPTAGTYNCRPVADTGQPSMHAVGAAIDINTRYAAYWHWRKGSLADRASIPPIPAEIVTIFERHGFIWGGKWFHYDTMHFEYRPELLPRQEKDEAPIGY